MIPVLTGLIIGLVIFAFRATYSRAVPEKRHGRIDLPEPPDPVTLLPIYEGLANAPENAPIKLVGTVRAGAAFTSALGGEPCVACLVGATVWHSKKVPQVVANLRDSSAAPFTLVLAAGEIEVDVTGIVVECPTRKVARNAERERVVLARHKLERHADSTDFTEGRILDGDRITIVGTLLRDSGGEQGYRDHVNRLRIAGTAAQPLRVMKAKK